MLAYASFACLVVGVVGIVVDSPAVSVPAIGFGLPLAIVHGIAFFVRVRHRTEPANLGGRAWILRTTLLAIAGVTIANFVIIAVYRRALGPSATSCMWMVVLAVLAYRTWNVPSARRAGVLQIVGVLLGIPQIVATAVTTTDASEHGDLAAVELWGWTMLTAMLVIVAAGPVLDKLFASVRDTSPPPIPEAIVHR